LGWGFELWWRRALGEESDEKKIVLHEKGHGICER
jgi:hypothetical protein